MIPNYRSTLGQFKIRANLFFTFTVCRPTGSAYLFLLQLSFDSPPYITRLQANRTNKLKVFSNFPIIFSMFSHLRTFFFPKENPFTIVCIKKHTLYFYFSNKIFTCPLLFHSYCLPLQSLPLSKLPILSMFFDSSFSIFFQNTFLA